MRKRNPRRDVYCPYCGSIQGTGGPVPGSAASNSGSYVGAYGKKSEGIALVLSFLLAGLGHIYVGKITTGLLYIVLSIVLVILGALLLFPLIIYLVLWIYCIYDSYHKAQEYNRTLIETGQPPW